MLSEPMPDFAGKPEPTLPASPIAGLSTIDLTPRFAPLLQKFFNDNPAYFLATSGAPASPDAAWEEITEPVPAEFSYTKKWVVGNIDTKGSLAAMANIITDLPVTAVFHVGTFIVATAHHGKVLAQTLYRGLESWAVGNGAAWMRLGVVEGNIRAERFWVSQGFIPVRRRSGILMGARSVTVQAMFKPLAAGTLEQYLALVARDRSDDVKAP